MPRAKAPPRVKGPYAERGGSRFRIRVCDVSGHRDLYFAMLQEAQTAIKQAARGLRQSSHCRQLGMVLDEYHHDKIQRGSCSARSAHDQRACLRGWLADFLDEDIGKLTSKRAALHYERLVQTPTRKTGQPPTAATHRYKLSLAQRMSRWAVRKGYVRESPFAAIQPVGRSSRGKKQLRFEEAERFLTAGFQLFDERQDTMALAAVTALLLGCRASEVVRLKVRDLDCGGTRLWIAAQDSEYRGKTRNAARNPEVPDALRPRLLQRTVDLRPAAYLFGVSSSGRPRSRQALYDAVRRVCLAAGVPTAGRSSCLIHVWASFTSASGSKTLHPSACATWCSTCCVGNSSASAAAGMGLDRAANCAKVRVMTLRRSTRRSARWHALGMHGRDTECPNTACCGELSARAKSRRSYSSSPRGPAQNRGWPNVKSLDLSNASIMQSNANCSIGTTPLPATHWARSAASFCDANAGASPAVPAWMGRAQQLVEERYDAPATPARSGRPLHLEGK